MWRAVAALPFEPLHQLALVAARRATEAGQDDGVEFQALGLVDRHQLDGGRGAGVGWCVELGQCLVEALQQRQVRGALVFAHQIEKGPGGGQVGSVGLQAGGTAEGEPDGLHGLAQAAAPALVQGLVQDRVGCGSDAGRAVRRQSSDTFFESAEQADDFGMPIVARQRGEIGERQAAPGRTQHGQPGRAVVGQDQGARPGRAARAPPGARRGAVRPPPGRAVARRVSSAAMPCRWVRLRASTAMVRWPVLLGGGRSGPPRAGPPVARRDRTGDGPVRRRPARGAVEGLGGGIADGAAVAVVLRAGTPWRRWS